MKEKGKAAVMKTTYGENNKFLDFNYSVSSDMPCIKHPNSSPIGICSFCLKERLVNLVCSDQSFSDDYTDRNSYSSNRNSCSVEVGSVGRISFLLENEKQGKAEQLENGKHGKTEQVILLRSNSNSVEIKKNRNGFWKIKRLFKKNRDEKSEISVPIGGGVSRSRSLCSFRNGDDSNGSENYRFSSAKISDVTGGLFFDYSDNFEPRKSQNGGDFKNLRKNIPNSDLCCSDSCRILQKHTTSGGSNIHSSTFLKSLNNSDKGKFFQVKESDFSTTTTTMDDDDSGFIDLKLDLLSSLSEPKLEFISGKRLSDCSDFGYDYANSMGDLRGGSCRLMNEYDRRMKRGNNSGNGNKVWKWIFRKSSTSKRDEISGNLIIKS